jgi:tRNA pseudouridine55 synthase
VDKPAGPTSHDVVARVRRALHTRAVGHTGTLDPFATGLLVVLVGRATRLARFVEQQVKTYCATARLGVRTTTDDLTGEELDGSVVGRLEFSPGGRAAEPPSRRAVEEALRSFLGPGRQRPPAYSAKHVAGERSYARARRGEAVVLPEIDIVVHAVELTEYDYPALSFRATVSPGTYVRALARDLGERLGTGAHLRALRREAIGMLRVEQAVALDAVSAEALLPPLAVLGHLSRVEVTEAEARALGHGQAVRRTGGPADLVAEPITVVGPDDSLIAVARWQEGALRPEVVLEAQG